MKLGIISDTHGYLDPRVPALFSGVDHIIHGGDIGPHSVILELEQLAPVTAVLGNTDGGLPFSETERLTLGGRTFLVHHVVEPRGRRDSIQDRIRREKPDVVIYGHTHKPWVETWDGTLYFNPGYAGRRRFQLPRSVAVMWVESEGIRHEFLSLDRDDASQ